MHIVGFRMVRTFLFVDLRRLWPTTSFSGFGEGDCSNVLPPAIACSGTPGAAWAVWGCRFIWCRGIRTDDNLLRDAAIYDFTSGAVSGTRRLRLVQCRIRDF